MGELGGGGGGGGVEGIHNAYSWRLHFCKATIRLLSVFVFLAVGPSSYLDIVYFNSSASFKKLKGGL